MSVENGQFDLTGQTPKEQTISKMKWMARIVFDPRIHPGMKSVFLTAIALGYRFNMLP